ncbi:MAG: hypothetical protein ACRDPE_22680 [Solirubrobacterales bacterium]
MDIEIGLPSAAGKRSRVGPPPRQVDFDANVQSRTPDLKVQEERLFNLFVPHTVPHGHFCGVLSSPQAKQKSRICGAFVK